MKKLSLLIAVVFMSFASFAQSSPSAITPIMAKKIALLCRSNNMAFSLFAHANQDVFQGNFSAADRTLSNLDVNLKCAENFIVALYNNYGVESSYFTLRDSGFIIKEIDIAEQIWDEQLAIWKKEREIKKQKEQEKKLANERELLQRINNNEPFNFHDLSNKPNINFDIYDFGANFIDSERYNKSIPYNEIIDCKFHCILSKENKLDLISNGSSPMTSSNKLIWEAFKSSIEVGVEGKAIMSLPLLDTIAIVPSLVNFELKQESFKGAKIEVRAKKDKKSEQWFILNEDELGSRMTQDLYLALSVQPYFSDIKGGKYSISAQATDNSLKFYIDGKFITSTFICYTFDLVILD